ALIYVPLWRIDTAIEGFHLSISHSAGPDGRLRWVLPTGGFRHRDEILMIPARRFFPVDPSKKVKISLDEMTPRQDHPIGEGELVLPDVSRVDAEREATERLRRKVQPSTALYSRFETRVRSAVLCHYPLWVLRYRYRGEAARDLGPEE